MRVKSQAQQARSCNEYKHNPIVDSARVLALDRGVSATRAVVRLAAVLEARVLSKDMHDNLIDALEFISSLRI